jgi:serine protease
MPNTLASNPEVVNTDTAFFVWSTYLLGLQGPASGNASGASGPTVNGVIGTSPAAPHVTGAAALLLSLSPGLTPATVRDLLQTSARPHPAGGYCNSVDGLGRCGAGLLDVGAALALHNTRRPAIAPIAAQTVNAGAVVTLTATATSNSGASGPITYAWTQTQGPTVSLNGANSAGASFTAPAAAGSLGFSVVATDANGYRHTQTAMVTVEAPTPAQTPSPRPAITGGGVAPAWPLLLLAALPLIGRGRRQRG